MFFGIELRSVLAQTFGIYPRSSTHTKYKENAWPLKKSLKLLHWRY